MHRILNKVFSGRKPRQVVQTNWPSSGRQDIMKSCRRESLKTCTTPSSLISIPSNKNKWKVQTYFYVTISILVNSYALGMLFDTFPINARNQNPRQCETTGKTAISYHRHIPNVCQTYPPQITRRSDVGIKLAWLLSSRTCMKMSA